ncbi:MAG: hypothetical protein ABJH68_13875 [Ilumatobacter sp.]|uniref:hypothetical protein n=1 Tax=Ilumatobacter sp. TaxID=1967498 RepID=UPI003297F066
MASAARPPSPRLDAGGPTTRFRRMRSTMAVTAGAVAALAGCTSGGAGAPPETGGDEVIGSASQDESTPCIVSLHGKGGDATPTETSGGLTLLGPRGNDEGWGGRQWNYLDDDSYAAAVSIVAGSIEDDACDSVAIHGFSNGASFAARLYCDAETFGGRLVGVVIDDPVTDTATENCEPDPDVDATLYWTGALESQAPAGTDCGGIDWTCKDGVVIGIGAFADAAGLDVTPSPFVEHRRFDDAPDPARWLEDVDA